MLETSQLVTPLTLALAVAAAWSMGHHYSGAVVGPAYGSRSIGMYLGIALAGVFVMIGSLATSVVSTYISLANTAGIYNVIALFSLTAMANITTYLKVPTSTIQLYTFSVLGTAVASGASIKIGLFLILGTGWVTAPLVSYFLGRRIHGLMSSGSENLRFVIIGIMLYSGLVLGLNDVSNAASSLVASGFNITLAKAVCGASMYLGMLMWGPRLIRRVGEELIAMDYRKAVSSQLTESIIISILNLFGLNASMNQTIVSSLAGLGARKNVLRSIIKGWIYSPLIGFTTAFLLSVLVRVL
jgi:inorganic phosphate transporter, PiT family